MKPDNIAELRHQALQCQMMAEAAKNEKDKQDWLTLAERWRRLIAARG
jgi:hypothetical protein